MTITRAQVEKTLLSRAAVRMEFVGMDAVTNNGTNADLNDPIATALMQSDITPADFTEIVDSDLSTVDDVQKLLDLAELRLLQNIHGNLDAVDLSVGPRRESLGQLGTQIESAIARMEAKCAKMYGLGAGTISGGNFTVDFQTKGDDTVI